ncbi:MAG: hypothetical protein Q8P86_03385 [bacterium]|nr:hypothetical protein [bacterium]
MKRFFVTILILFFAGVSVFGVYNVGERGWQNVGCINALLKGEKCPQGNVSEFLNFHFGASKIFSTAVFTAGVLVLAIFLLLAFAVDRFLKNTSGKLLAVFIFVRKRFQEPFIKSEYRDKFTYWLSLLENSPSSL